MLDHLSSVARLRGLVNATTTFILSAMAEGRSYEAAVAEAQAAGYAEADASFDVSGRDAAQKLAILASVAWGAWQRETDVATSGITDVRVEPGSTIRLVASATPESLTVAPTELDASDSLATAAGIECVLEIATAQTGTVTVRGPGAGGAVTAGAVYADLARLVRGERPVIGQSVGRRPVHA